MWKAAVLAAVLLVALAGRGARAGEGGGEGRPSSSVFGVKLCGREFIRAVIFTCGGSRWKRAVADDDDLPFDLDAATSDPWSSDPLPALLGERRPGSEDPPPRRRAQPASDAGAFFFGRASRSAMSEDVLGALRSADRKGRDVVVGLSNACCKWGCSKSEISSLC